MGFLEDTGMRTNQFSNLALVFYVSYLFFEFPTGYLMQRLPTAKYLGMNGRSPERLGYTRIDGSSHPLGSFDHLELRSEELPRTDRPPRSPRLLRKRCRSLVRLPRPEGPRR